MRSSISTRKSTFDALRATHFWGWAFRQATDAVRTRLMITGVLFCLCFVAIAARLVDVMVLSGVSEQAGDVSRPVSLEMSRADIVDRNGHVLATSLVTQSLYANPKEILDVEEAVEKIRTLFPQIDAMDLRQKLSSQKGFIWLARHLTPKQQDQVNRLGVPGIYFQKDEKRVYPHGNLLSHVLGYTDVDGRGISGVEGAFNSDLLGKSDSLKLSLDVRVQHVLHDELLKGYEEFGAIGGAGLVLDVHTGEVLAMVSLPDFDPNNPSKCSDVQAFNMVTKGIYEMGSTFKIFTVAMALESGIANIYTRFDATKPLKVGRFTITGFHEKHAWLTLSEIFLYSSTIGTAKIAMEIGPKLQQQYLKKLGLLEKSDIELTEVGKPKLPKMWKDITAMTVSYGYGLAISPLQLAAAISPMVNGGFKLSPTLVANKNMEHASKQRVLSPKVSQMMRKLMRMVVTSGTGRKANAQGYGVIGKTGTAHKQQGRGYNTNARLSSFVGAFPVSNPQYVVLVILNEPKGTTKTHGYGTGGWTATPVAGNIVERIAPLLGVLPRESDDEDEELKQMILKVNYKGE